MHRARVDRAFRNRLFRCGLGLIEIRFGGGGELRATAGRTEMVNVTLVIESVLARRRIDGHPANWIHDLSVSRNGMVVMLMSVVIMAATAASCFGFVGARGRACLRGAAAFALGISLFRIGHLSLLWDLQLIPYGGI